MFNKKNTQFIHRLVSVVALCGILLVQVLPVRAQSAPPPPPRHHRLRLPLRLRHLSRLKNLRLRQIRPPLILLPLQLRPTPHLSPLPLPPLSPNRYQTPQFPWLPRLESRTRVKFKTASPATP